MATITGYTAERMKEIEDASIIDGEVNGAGNLILTRYDGTDIDAGSVIGPEGPVSSPEVEEAPLGTIGYIRRNGFWVPSLVREVFTASGTWTKPAGALLVKAELISGGGGGCSTGGASYTGGAGGGGGFIEEIFEATTLGATVSVTIGAGGGVDVNGGTSSFGSHLSVLGGAKGLGVNGGKGGGFDGARGGLEYGEPDNTAKSSTWGGGGGAGGHATNNNAHSGGKSVRGGGGGSASNTAGGTSGTSGDGGMGGFGTNAANGSIPGGGGGSVAGTPGTGGTGARGEVVVTTYF